MIKNFPYTIHYIRKYHVCTYHRLELNTLHMPFQTIRKSVPSKNISCNCIYFSYISRSIHQIQTLSTSPLQPPFFLPFLNGIEEEASAKKDSWLFTIVIVIASYDSTISTRNSHAHQNTPLTDLKMPTPPASSSILGPPVNGIPTHLRANAIKRCPWATHKISKISSFDSFKAVI